MTLGFGRAFLIFTEVSTMDSAAGPELHIPPGIQIDHGNANLVARIKECLSHPLAESFKENLERLAGFARSGSKVRIGMDFAPLSFGFAVIRPDGSCWIVGGLIYHGPHDRGGDGGAPTYSVCVQPVSGWSLHT